MASYSLRKTDPFEALLIEILETHRGKGNDYADEADRLQNFRRVSARHYGTQTPREQADIMVQHKQERLVNIWEQAAKDPNFEVANEGLDDTYKDRAVYCILAWQLLREEQT